MHTKKILFVSMTPLNYNSSATIQNHGIVRGLSELGHNVDILTLEPDEKAVAYDSSMNYIYDFVDDYFYLELTKLYNTFSAKKSNENITENTNQDKNQYLIKQFKNVIKKVHKSFQIYDLQKHNIKNLDKLEIDCSKYDFIISSSDPKSSHLIVRKLLKRANCKKLKWIQYWGDPFYHDISRKKTVTDFLVKYAEKRLITNAYKIVYASPLTLDIQKETYPQFINKMEFATQAFNGINEEEKLNTKLGYYGAYFSNVRNILPFYNTVKKMKLELEIIGQNDLDLEPTELIKVKDRVAYNEIVEKEKTAEILVAITNSHGTQIPGKLYYLSGYKQPIIVIVDGDKKNELLEFLSSFNRFIICENNEESIVEAINLAKLELKEGKKYFVDKRLEPEYFASKILEEL